MPLEPIRLDLMATKGIPLRIELHQDGHQGPPVGKHWLLLGGVIEHDDSGVSMIYVKKVNEALTAYKERFYTAIPATAPVSGSYPIFNCLNNAMCSQWTPVILCSDDEFWVHGGATIEVRLDVIEW